MTAATENLLVELFVEELPPKALLSLGDAFAEAMKASLQAQGLAEAGAVATAFASPRRLAAHVTNVLATAPDRPELLKLMPVSIGLDAQGRPSPALLKKLTSLGMGTSQTTGLRRMGEGKAESLFMERSIPGIALAKGLSLAIEHALAALPIPKVMTYQLSDGWTSVKFVRPAHGLVALHGSQAVPATALGLVADRRTLGHRFEGNPGGIHIRSADSYAEQLEAEGAVIAAFVTRRAEIERQMDAAARVQGLQAIRDEALLDEVTGLVERPNVLCCQFDPVFLDVPQECLILTMKANQKYFPLLDGQGRLTNRFLVVSNVRPDDPAQIISGNERVVRPRLADAKFFFDQDRKRSLESRVAGLAKVVYHNQLGTQRQRVERVRQIARAVGGWLDGPALAESAARAALLAKADLHTDMVGEFPELQGIMGGYYARHDGEHEDVAFAIEDHYRPRFAGDALPRNRVGLAVALADKLETLAGLFGIGQIPSGDKDPFALRRHALGVIRMLIEGDLALELPKLIDVAFKAFPDGHGQAQTQMLQFFLDRLTGYLRELGFRAQEIDAVVEARPDLWSDIPRRLAAVRVFVALPEADALAAANKRVGNILKKAGDSSQAGVRADLIRESAESALYQALQSIRPAADEAFALGDYAASLSMLAALRAPVDAFFETVMVNVEETDLRNNRLALLHELRVAMNRVADLSRLAA